MFKSSATKVNDHWHEVLTKNEMINKLLSFLDTSPSPYHAVSNLSKRLTAVGFGRLDEGKSWSGALQPGGKYYFTRNGSAMVAFAIGNNYVLETTSMFRDNFVS